MRTLITFPKSACQGHQQAWQEWVNANEIMNTGKVKLAQQHTLIRGCWTTWTCLKAMRLFSSRKIQLGTTEGRGFAWPIGYKELESASGLYMPFPVPILEAELWLPHLSG